MREKERLILMNLKQHRLGLSLMHKYRQHHYISKSLKMGSKQYYGAVYK